jgi:hypothetical protein
MAVESGFDLTEHGFHIRNRFSELDVLNEVDDDGLGGIAGQLAVSARISGTAGVCVAGWLGTSSIVSMPRTRSRLPSRSPMAIRRYFGRGFKECE